ncbi:TonB-dependent receptor domain-containing protein [Mariniphaga sediminis]|uniref:TonB-dependent receptor domain-containing protein n=1 Tax=Mariniphaga sediminis TaxID=1628158 RepID=UPI0035680D03
MKSLVEKRYFTIKYIILSLFLLGSISICAQNTSTITGKILDAKNNQPLPYATLRFMDISGNTSQWLSGTISDDNGVFSINQIPNGKYQLQVTSVGYRTANKTFEITTPATINAGVIYLQDSLLFIAETLIVADRIQGKSETDKTIYYINNKMLSATGNAPELLRHIPGVQVDLKQNISINGQSNILLFVDGKERDKSYISQLSPSTIDKIEVLDTPPPNYDGNVSGVINIVLKKENVSGFSGHLFSEIPLSSEVIYMFPTYRLNYNYNKINLYTSYNGEINYENIDEKISRQIIGKTAITNLSSVQYVRQKNLSHKFHYGIDYHLTPKDVFNFYGFLNPYSYEQDGNVILQATGNSGWEARREETDKNKNRLNSLYYKHLFNTEKRELTIDISHAHIRSENKVSYQNDMENQTNTERPGQTTFVWKVDFINPLNEHLNWSSGIKMKTRDMHDNTSDGFRFNEQVYALYSSLNYQTPNFNVNLGLRAENAKTKLNENQHNSSFSLLPYVAFHYQISQYSDLYLSYRRSVNRPSVYSLNPYTYIDDPYTLRKGNPLLSSEFRNQIQLEYSTRFKSNYMSARLFYETRSHAINHLTYLNDNRIFVTQAHNLGNIHQYGLQLAGALKFGIVSVNPSFRFYNQSTFANNTAKRYGVANKNNLVVESSISSILSFKKSFALSAIFQYATPKENIQNNAFCEALYFISLDKTFKKNLKVGIVSALPFAKTFVYQGSEIQSTTFTSEYTGNLKLPTVPLMFRLSYRFNSGKNRNILTREKEYVDTRPKQGF